MNVIARIFMALALVMCAAPASASDATLLRVFLADGTSFVSFGEFARIDDRIVFSMPVGGSLESPRLHVLTIPAASVDWTRTDRYSASARYHQYASTRGEEDFRRLSDDVARVLAEIGQSTDVARALDIATRARHTMAAWPGGHYAYRQTDVQEIVSLLDEAINELRVRAGGGAFEVALMAGLAPAPFEPLLGPPNAQETLDAILRAARLADRATERVSLLESALMLMHEAGSAFRNSAIDGLRKRIEGEIREERQVDARYTSLAGRLLGAARRGANSGNVRQVESALAKIAPEDERLGRRRPDVVQALYASVQTHLSEARQLRLLQDRWMLRRQLYRDYQNSVAVPLLQLVKAQSVLEGIRRFEGPDHAGLTRLHARFSGSASQLMRVRHPADLDAAHQLLVEASRFAEQAIETRRAAIASGNVDTAWAASAAAAGSLMLLSKAQEELRSFLEPPRLK